jgi:hypothetical protein
VFRKVYSARADICSLGLVLCELATDVPWPARLHHERTRGDADAALSAARAVYPAGDASVFYHSFNRAMDAAVSAAVSAVPQLGAAADGCLCVSTAARWTLPQVAAALALQPVRLASIARSVALCDACAHTRSLGVHRPQSDVAAHAQGALDAVISPHGVSCPPADEATLIAAVHTAQRLGTPLHAPGIAAAHALVAALDAPHRFPLAARIAAAHALPSCGADALWAGAPGEEVPSVVAALLHVAKEPREPAALRIAALHAALWVRPASLVDDMASLLTDVASLAHQRPGADGSQAVAAAASRANRAMLALLSAP